MAVTRSLSENKKLLAVINVLKQALGVKRHFALIALLLACLPLTAAILPEDRFDALYHYYSGGGVDISGPSLLFRKQVADPVSMSTHYYVDTISSASIDVVTQASPYNEERTEYGLNVDYLNGKSLLSMGYTTSSENDYVANTVNIGISQDFFGDLTNISLGFARGSDTVSRSTDDVFERQVERRNYRLGLSQILSKNMTVVLAFDLTSDEGFLNNPYRRYRYSTTVNSTPTENWDYERYPGTRTSTAFGMRGLYYLPYRAAIGLEVRQFSDTWGVNAQNWQVFYRHPTDIGWLFEVRYRQYSQNQASFYADLFNAPNAQNYMARDKELSTYSSQTFGVTASYGFNTGALSWIERGSVNLSWDYMQFDYANFRDASVDQNEYGVGNEPFYGFSANIIQLYLSVWY